MRIITAREQVEMLSPWRMAVADVVLRHHPVDDGSLPNGPGFQSLSAPAVTAWRRGMPIGSLEWTPQGEVSGIFVHPDHRGEDIGTEMFDFAKQHEPGIHHSTNQTAQGKGWAAYEQSREAASEQPHKMPPRLLPDGWVAYPNEPEDFPPEIDYEQRGSHEHPQYNNPEGWEGCAHPDCRPDLPTTMYHQSHPRNRQSIAQQGLLVSHSHPEAPRNAVYMGTNAPKESDPEGPFPGDVWAIDTTKLKHLENEEPIGGLGAWPPGKQHYWTKNDIPPEAMRPHRLAPRWGPGEDNFQRYQEGTHPSSRIRD